MSDNGGRRKWGAAEALRIVLAGMQRGVEVSDLGRREGLNPVQLYAWKKPLPGLVERVFVDRRGRPHAQQVRLEAESVRFQGVIAEIAAENFELRN